MNMKMKKYRYIISAVAAVAAVSVILSACASGKESNASSAAPGLSTSAQESTGSSSGDISGSESNDKKQHIISKGSEGRYRKGIRRQLSARSGYGRRNDRERIRTYKGYV